MGSNSLSYLEMSLAEAVIYAQETFRSSCVDTASFALLLYEYAITSDSEVSLFWVRKWPASILFFAVRFLMLATALFGIVTTASSDFTHLSSCMASIILSMFIQFTSLATIAVVSAMRVYAVSGRRWLVAAFTLIVGAVPVGVNVYSATQAKIYLTDGVCSYNSTISSREGFIFALLSRLCTVTCDIIVVATIWIKAYRLVKTHVHAWSCRPSLMWYLLRDGTAYFVVMLALNIVDICIVYFDDEVDFIHSTILPLSLILISRLLINLREVAYHRDIGGEMTTSSASSFEVETPFEVSTIVFDPAMEDGRAMGLENEPCPHLAGLGRAKSSPAPEECLCDDDADEIELREV